MRSTRNAAALAVALGVGAAVAAGSGVASADSTAGQDPGTAAATRGTQSAPAKATTGGARRGRGPAPAAAAAKTPNTARKTSPAPDAPTPALPATSVAAQPLWQPPASNVAAPAPSAAPIAKAVALPVTAPVPRPTAATAVPAVVSANPGAGPGAAPPALSGAAKGGGPRLLNAARLVSQGAGSAPGAPVDSPALWALAAWTRRQTTPPAAAVAQPKSLTSDHIGWVTGQRNSAIPGALWPQTNNTKWANVYGTDLGIMWFNGVNGLTQLAFGDTFSGANMTGGWRSNILLLSNDTNLSDGLSLINTGPANQFIPAAPKQVFFIGSEVTNIPTSAVYANSNNYVSYMSVKSWDTPGRWTTNYSAISQYDPATDKWVLQKNTVRPAALFRSSQMYHPGDQNFQQMAYVLEPESQVAPGDTRYVYAFGTPSGRAGSAYLSRVPEGSLTDLSKYEYWDGAKWVNKEAKAAPVLGDSTRSGGILGPIRDLANNPKFFGGWLAGIVGAKTGGNVSEMSIQYNDYLGKYVVLYGNGANNVILRTADTPEGAWSDPITIATSIQYPGLYAPMIHPLSGTGMLTTTDGSPDVSNLYWNMSIWSNYNVVLMKTDLSPLKVTPA